MEQLLQLLIHRKGASSLRNNLQVLRHQTVVESLDTIRRVDVANAFENGGELLLVVDESVDLHVPLDHVERVRDRVGGDAARHAAQNALQPDRNIGVGVEVLAVVLVGGVVDGHVRHQRHQTHQHAPVEATQPVLAISIGRHLHDLLEGSSVAHVDLRPHEVDGVRGHHGEHSGESA